MPDADINAPEAWSLTNGSPATKIGIIDNGVYSHIEFGNRINGDGPSWQNENPEHGTAVAGIIMAQGDSPNDEGIAGTAWNTQVYSKDCGSEGWDATDVYQSVVDLIWEDNVIAINNSWGGTDNDIIRLAFVHAANVGVPMVVARGNTYGYDARYPGCYDDWVISVGAMSHQLSIPQYSGLGCGIDLVAPGGFARGIPEEDVLTTTLDNYYGHRYRTSIATPHVTGAIGLLDGYHNLQPYASDMYEILTRTARDYGLTGYDDEWGFGLLDAGAALEYVTPSESNAIYQLRQAMGSDPYVFETDDTFRYMYCYNFHSANYPSLQYGLYMAKRYEVRYDFYYENNPSIGNDFRIYAPDVWSEYFATSGYSDEGYNDNSAKNWGRRWCRIIEATADYVTLSTYVFEVRQAQFPYAYFGFFPNPPGECDFYVTVVGDNISPEAPTGFYIDSSPDHHPHLHWNPNPENDILRYNIYRKVYSEEDHFVCIGSVPFGTNEYIDTEYAIPHSGKIAYWTSLADYKITAQDNCYNLSDYSNTETIEVVVPEYPEKPIPKQSLSSEQIPAHYSLSSVFPNPFNAMTTIRYSLPEKTFVKLDIINCSGQLVATLVSESQSLGFKEVVWNASNVASGIYFCKIAANNFIATKQLTLVK